MLTHVATKNRGKLAELEAIFAGTPLRLATYDAYADVIEGDASFQANALLKARSLRAQLTAAHIEGAVLADDSGLEVSALGGRPGVLSARYGGESATWAQRRQMLLAEMETVPDAKRSARFVCVMALILPDGKTLTAEGVIGGRLARDERGAGGFGYDPIFVPDGFAESFSEISKERKNSISHRRRAADALLERLRG